jgi:hypothetical protein
MHGEHVQPTDHEGKEDVLSRGPEHLGVYRNSEGVVCFTRKAGFVS